MRTVRLLGVLILALTGLLATPLAQAHSGIVTIDCTGVTFAYSNFPNQPGNTVTQTVTVDGTRVATTTFVFDGPSGTSTVPISVPDAGPHPVEAKANWDTNGSVGSLKKSQTLTGCPGPCPGTPDPAGANASGDAMGLLVQAPLLSIPGRTRASSSQSGVGSSHDDDDLLTINLPGIAKVVGLLTVSDSRVTEAPSEGNAQSTAETAGIRLLNGVITADVVRANVEAIARGDSSAFTDAGSTFQNLVINGVRIETVRPNTRIDLPFLGRGAHVTLFETIGSTSAPPANQLSGGTYTADVTVNMIHVVIPSNIPLLAPVEIIVSQARAHADFPQTTRCTPGSGLDAVSGHAYILSATIDHPLAPAVLVGYAGIPASGGAGSQALAEVNIPGLVTLGAAKSTSNGTIGAESTKATSRATVAGVDLFDGRITATLVQTQSHSRADAGSTPFSNAKGTQLLNISVMGQTIPDNPSPNMRYEMPGFGYVVFNEQIPDGPAPGHSGLTVRMIHLHADRLLGVLPGGDVIIAESHSDVTR